MRTVNKKIATAVLCTGLFALAGCGGADDATSSDISTAAASASGSTSCNTVCPEASTNWYANKKSKYAKDTQCLTQIQAAESYRQASIANCSAGSTTGATGNCSYYKTSVSYVNSICP